MTSANGYKIINNTKALPQSVYLHKRAVIYIPCITDKVHLLTNNVIINNIAAYQLHYLPQHYATRIN